MTKGTQAKIVNLDDPEDLNTLWHQELQEGNTEQSIYILRRMLYILQMHDGCELQIATLLYNLGISYSQISQPETAEQLHRQALALFKQFKETERQQALCLQVLIQTLHSLGRSLETIHIYPEVIELLKSVYIMLLRFLISTCVALENCEIV